MENEKITDQQIKNLLQKVDEPSPYFMDLEEAIMKNLPDQRPYKTQIIRCYKRMHLGFLITLLSFVSFLLWAFLEGQYNPGDTFLDYNELLGYTLMAIVMLYMLFEVFQKATDRIKRLELSQ